MATYNNAYGRHRVVNSRRRQDSNTISRQYRRVSSLALYSQVRYHNQFINSSRSQQNSRHNNSTSALLLPTKGLVQMFRRRILKGPRFIGRHLSAVGALIGQRVMVRVRQRTSRLNGHRRKIRHNDQVLRRRTRVAPTRVNRNNVIRSSRLFTTSRSQATCPYHVKRRPRRNLNSRKFTQPKKASRTSPFTVNCTRTRVTRSKLHAGNSIRSTGFGARTTSLDSKLIGKSVTSHDTSPGEYGTVAIVIAADPNRDAIDK